ncbi:30S ribosomal protein S4 [Candidatus Woesearchaeota archaeon CG10_big_fil_rev_8_21_14_0_10_30_7]|nr:MAG: 30S ribosomal protein S4 [Candidatus Woesearchaeota archaeon CG10_big_fil_rev_8_21_14_0_10_30_7]
MGDIKRIRKKYSDPMHPWEKTRIEEEKQILLNYGLKNKTEIWRMNSVLKGFSDQAKKLIALQTNQAEKEKKQLLQKLYNLGLLSAEAGLNDVLTLTLQDILNRRLQTIVYKKGLAKSVRQARQFINHEHIIIENYAITSPAYLVSTSEELNVTFVQNSKLASSDHPERIQVKPSKEKIEKKEKPKKEKNDNHHKKRAEAKK